MKRKILSYVLVFLMVAAYMPVIAFAEIVTIDISDSRLISISIDSTDDFEYDGTSKTPKITVKYGTETIFIQNEDYTTTLGAGLRDIATLEAPTEAVFLNNVEAGTATVRVNLELEGLINSYTGSAEREFEIKQRPVLPEELFSVNCANRGVSVEEMLKDSSYQNIYDQACDELDRLIQDVAREYDGTTASNLKTAYALYITGPMSYDLVAVDGTASYKSAGVSDKAQLTFTPKEVSNAQSQNYYIQSKNPVTIDSKITRKTVFVGPEDVEITVGNMPELTFSVGADVPVDDELSAYLAGLNADSITVADENGNPIDLSLAVSVPGTYTMTLKNEAAFVTLEKYTIRPDSATLTVKGDTNIETADRYKMGFESYVNSDGIAAISSIYTEKLPEVGSEGDIGYAELDFTATGKYVKGVSIPYKVLQKLEVALEKNPFIMGFYITTSNGSIKFDTKALSVLTAEAQLAGNASTEIGFDTMDRSALTAAQEAALAGYNIIRLFNVYAKCGTKEIKALVGNAEVIIPYKVPAGMHWYKYVLKTVEADGTMGERVAFCDETAGTVSVLVNRLSGFALAYQQCDGDYACPSYWYKDVNNGDWFHEAVDYVISAGIMNGTDLSTFSPNANITRGMIVTILWRMQNKPAGKKAVFPDVHTGSYYEEAIGWAAGAGIVNGYSRWSFGPDDPITREQLAAILCRYSQYLGKSVENSGDITGFADYAKVSDYALKEMKWAVGKGLITGTTGNLLDPQGKATRAQAAAILYRFG